MITHFDTLEADFQREYGIDLAREVWWMPWRRLIVLIRGLSTESGWYRLAAKHTKVRRISGRDVDAYFDTIGA